MKELKLIIADNLMNLRKTNKLTQMELAEKLNYSDKAISKWERGDSLPDIILLKELADMYGVSVDYIMTEHTREDAKKIKRKKPELNNKLIITLLACLVVWICATIIYVNLMILQGINYWMIWLWAVPVSSIVLIVFTSIWGRKTYILTSVSLLIWSLLICFHLEFIEYNIWTIYFLGIPLQIAIFLWSRLKPRNKKDN